MYYKLLLFYIKSINYLWYFLFYFYLYMKIQLFESVKAWFPSLDQHEWKYIDIDNFLIEKPYSTIFLKVNWDSMVGEWIINWDYVIVDKSLEAKIWDIVIWLIDWEYTLKYLSLDSDNNKYLKSANDDFPDIYPKFELQIFWVVTGVFRKYK